MYLGHQAGRSGQTPHCSPFNTSRNSLSTEVKTSVPHEDKVYWKTDFFQLQDLKEATTAHLLTFIMGPWTQVNITNQQTIQNIHTIQL